MPEPSARTVLPLLEVLINDATSLRAGSVLFQSPCHQFESELVWRPDPPCDGGAFQREWIIADGDRAAVCSETTAETERLRKCFVHLSQVLASTIRVCEEARRF